MHDGPIEEGDAWLKQHLDAYAEGVALSLAALAFFVGYSVEVVFQIIKILVIKVVGQLQK